MVPNHPGTAETLLATSQALEGSGEEAKAALTGGGKLVLPFMAVHWAPHTPCNEPTAQTQD